MASLGMMCPSCHADLVMTERQGVEIDYCPRCRGVWLDRGELDKIIERSLAYFAGPETPHASRYMEGRHPRDWRKWGEDEEGAEYRRRKRKGSFLEELFDFD